VRTPEFHVTSEATIWLGVGFVFFWGFFLFQVGSVFDGGGFWGGGLCLFCLRFTKFFLGAVVVGVVFWALLGDPLFHALTRPKFL